MATGNENPGDGRNLSYGVGINLNYNMDDDYKEGRCGHGLMGTAGVEEDEDGYEMGRASGVLFRSRACDKQHKVAVEAKGPGGNAGSGVHKGNMDVYAAGNIGEASVHAGPLGVEVKGPGAEAKCKAGKDGVNVAAGADAVSGKVQLGAVDIGAGVGIQGKFVAGKDGVGTIIPAVGGLVVEPRGFEVGIGPVSFKFKW